MQLQEYNKQFDNLLAKYRLSNEDDDRDALIDAQYAYMESVLAEIEPDTKLYDLIHELTYYSTTGQATESFNTEEEANDFDIMVWENYEDMALDSQVYKDGDEWIVDYMFGGAYCPAWDGLDE